MDDDDSYFLVGGLRCKARANWNITIGVRQLSKAVQKTVKMRADEDREQAVRRYVEENHLAAAAALIDAPALSPPPPQGRAAGAPLASP